MRGQGGSGIPKLYVKFWWPLFLAKSHIFIPKCIKGGGSNGLGIIPEKYHFFTASLSLVKAQCM